MCFLILVNVKFLPHMNIEQLEQSWNPGPPSWSNLCSVTQTPVTLAILKKYCASQCAGFALSRVMRERMCWRHNGIYKKSICNTANVVKPARARQAPSPTARSGKGKYCQSLSPVLSVPVDLPTFFFPYTLHRQARTSTDDFSLFFFSFPSAGCLPVDQRQ